MDSTMYPQGSGGLKARYIDGVLVFFNATGATVYTINPATRTITIPEGATFAIDSDQLVVTTPDDATIEVDSGDGLRVKDGGIHLAKLGDYGEGVTIESLLDVLANIPTSDQLDEATIWNDSGVLKVSGSAG